MSVSTSSRSGHSTLCLSTSQSFPSTSQSFPSTSHSFPSTSPSFRSTSPSFRSTSPSFRSTSPSFHSTSPSSDTSHSSVLSAKLSVLSGKLGLPNVAIDGIAKKAAEILQTEGAIASAPGQPAEARMVISRSGKRPHLVIPKKMGGMACDDDCPMYKSAKLCSHTVAAAEYNRQLDQFVASYGKVKKTPNLTKLAMAEMPKGRGRKGTRARAKRKPSLPVQSRVELNPSTPGGLNRVSLPPSVSLTVAPVYQPSVSAPISVVASPQASGSYQFPGPFTPPFPGSFMPPPPHTPFGSTYTSPYSSVPASYGMDATSGGAYPFRVCMIAGNISVCNGCKGRYKKVGPPHDICLQHEEWRTFTPHGSTTPQTRFGNVYYHCSVACVTAVWPCFIPSSILVPFEVQSRLLLEHKTWLYVTFGVSV